MKTIRLVDDSTDDLEKKLEEQECKTLMNEVVRVVRSLNSHTI